MANIVINNYCNLQCPYCFADIIKQQDAYSMSVEEFQENLNFFSGINAESLGLIGGEPTLHPQFDQILQLSLNYIQQNETDSILFTNGINLIAYLSLLEQFQDKILILINCNDPIVQGEYWDTFIQNLDAIFASEVLRDRVVLGCNIYLNQADYSYFWNLIDKYNAEYIRLSVAAPEGIFISYKDKKFEYYNLLKSTFLNFIQTAQEKDKFVQLDCNHIPYCMFSNEELELVESVCGVTPLVDQCNLPLAILPEHKAIFCFSANESVDLQNFSSAAELRQYLIFNIQYRYMIHNNDGNCKNCQKFQHFTCQGGCLAFAHLE